MLFKEESIKERVETSRSFFLGFFWVGIGYLALLVSKSVTFAPNSQHANLIATKTNQQPIILTNKNSILAECSEELINQTVFNTYTLKPLQTSCWITSVGKDIEVCKPIETSFIKNKNESLNAFLSRIGFNSNEIKSLSKFNTLRSLKKGSEVILVSSGDQVNEIKIPSDFEADVVIKYDDNVFSANKIKKQFIKTVACARGVVNSDINADIIFQGVPKEVLKEFTKTMGSIISLQKSIRSGDSFEIFYDQMKEKNSGKTKSSNLLYASINTRKNNKISIYRFRPFNERESFFTSKGEPINKPVCLCFLKSPLCGGQISSRFGCKRIGHRHKGIDLSAAYGTPVTAAGDGIVTKATYWGKYGKCICIKHSGGYETLYAHLSRYSVKSGTTVKQGQTIGSVGNTGYSTGPHLHHEVLLNGRNINPASMNKVATTPSKLTGRTLRKFEETKRTIDEAVSRSSI